MHKVIIGNSEIDLSNKSLTINEENSWFSDSFFTKYSYPFEVSITKSLNDLLSDILSYESAGSTHVVDCKYVFHDKLENSKLYVEEINAEVMSLSMQYGIDEFPNFEKKLAELDLLKINVANIYTHANSVIEQTYPLVNYNFPMVHTDKYEPTDPIYNGFEKIINKRTGNIFVQNVVDGDNMLNKNIIQPMPYLMYVLKKGFELSGRIIEGDILNDPILNKMILFCERDYVSRIESSAIDIVINADNVNQYNSIWIENYGYHVEYVTTITQPGKYNLIGDIVLGNMVLPMFSGRIAAVKISVNNRVIGIGHEFSTSNKTHLCDLFFEVLPETPVELKIEFETTFYEHVDTINLQCLPVYYYDSNGQKMTNLFNSNEIDLNKTVPDITFGALFNTIMNWFNYDVDEFTDDKIVINKIENSMLNNEVLDLSMFDNYGVSRKPNNDYSFHLKYNEEGDVDLGGMYIDMNQVVSTKKDFTKEVKNTIEINAYVLQTEERSGIRTAKSIGSAEDKLCVVMYSGTKFFENITDEPTELSIENIFANYHYKWFSNRINTVSYTFSFVTNIEKIIYLTTKKRIYSYNNIHLIKSIQRREISPDIFEVELETEVLKNL